MTNPTRPDYNLFYLRPATNLQNPTSTRTSDTFEIKDRLLEMGLPSDWRLDDYAPMIIQPPTEGEGWKKSWSDYLIRACDTGDQDKLNAGRYVRAFRRAPYHAEANKDGWVLDITLGPYLGKGWKERMAGTVFQLYKAIDSVLPTK